MAVTRQRGYAYGVALVLLGGICLSLGGILVRSMEAADGWQILFYRACSFFVTLFLILFAKYRSKTLQAFRAVGLRGIAVAVVLGLGSVCYVFAILTTTVANALFIIAAAPLVTAAAAWLFLNERVSMQSVLAMLAALLGVGLMFVDGISAGRWLGNIMAVCVVVSFAAMLIILRGSRQIDMLPATCMAGIVGALIAGSLATDLVITPHDLLLTIILGSVQFTGGFMLFTIATRYLAAAEVALFSLSESVLAPIWVWIGVGEVPSRLTLIGSVVVFTAVVTHCFLTIRQERATTAG